MNMNSYDITEFDLQINVINTINEQELSSITGELKRKEEEETHLEKDLKDSKAKVISLESIVATLTSDSDMEKSAKEFVLAANLTLSSSLKEIEGVTRRNFEEGAKWECFDKVL